MNLFEVVEGNDLNSTQNKVIYIFLKLFSMQYTSWDITKKME